MSDIFSEISVVIIIATVVSFLMKQLKQPLILGYILSGLLVGPAAFNLIHNTEIFDAFSHIGITLLLFIIGLGLNVGVIKKLGGIVFAAAATELVVVGGAGFLVGRALGFEQVEALIIGLCLFFSSTIIIVKMLTDKNEQNRLHGQIAIGIILLDDIVATLALLFVAAGKDNAISIADVSMLLLKGGLLLAFLAFCSTQLLPKISRLLASSQELLFLAAISWGFGIATLFNYVGFSTEVGALFAGVSLASLPYAQEIGSRLKPLRDFFVVLFFIVLGESLNLHNLSAGLGAALVLAALVIILKPLTITGLLGWRGYTKRVSFKAGINLSQISEFSIVLVVLAASVGMINPDISAIITLVAIITIATSTYLMAYDDKLFAKFDSLNLWLFEKRAIYTETRSISNYPAILFGYQKGGQEFVKLFHQMNQDYVVIDYDPEIIDVLQHHKINHLYGDVTDIELLEEAGVAKAKLIVCTITDFHSSLFLLKYLERKNSNSVVIVEADNPGQATELYENGASYVILPHFIGSEHISAFVKRSGLQKSAFKKERAKHLRSLERQLRSLEKGDEHDKKLGQTIIESVATLTKVKS